jgi:hypothetical protein
MGGLYESAQFDFDPNQIIISVEEINELETVSKKLI